MGTITLGDDDSPRQVWPGGESLILALDAAHPLHPPRCISLVEIDEVVFGRGAAAAAAEAGSRRLRVDLADQAVSGTHARLVRAGAGWTITDEQSKNGTLLDGRRVAEGTLTAANLLELGNSFFLLRRGAVLPGPGPSALRTLNGALAAALDLLARVSRSPLPILVQGETGTGKEMLARAAHELSGRPGPFVAVNCGAIPGTLVESELFGARRGAFSGAGADRTGMVAAADGGTLFLDEIAELPEPSQAALLRVLQDGEIVPLGSARPIHIDVRIIAATHADLRERASAGRFRDDLHARLRGHVLSLPPLRARREDLGLLCAELLGRLAGPRAASLVLQRAAARVLMSYRWPHNIRELGHVLARAVAVLQGDEIRLEDLPEELTAPTTVVADDAAADERARVIQALRRHGGNLTAAARELSTSRSQLRRLVARYQIDLAEVRRTD